MRFPLRCTALALKFLALCLVLGFVCGRVCAQKSASPPKPQPEIQALINQADKAERQYQWNEALHLLEAARQKAVSVKDRVGEATAINNVGLVYSNIGQPQKALDLLQQVLPLEREVGDKAGEAVTLNNIGGISADIGEPQKALAFLQQALSLSREVGDKSLEAVTLSNIGKVYSQIGQPQKALVFYQQALPLSREEKDKEGEARTLNNVGLVYTDIGQPQQALEVFDQALALEREVGDKAVEATTLANIGLVYSNIGQPQKALDFFQQALPIHRVVGDKAGEASTLNNIGGVYSAISQPQKALDFLQQALPLRRAVRDKAGEATTLGNIGLVYFNGGQPQKAWAFFRKALQLENEVGDRVGEARALNNIGSVYSRIGQPQQALDFFQQSLPLSREVEDKSLEAVALSNIGKVYSDLGQPQKALEFFQQALPLSRKTGDKAGEAATLNDIGGVYSRVGQPQQALDFFEQSLALEREVGDRQGEATQLSNIGKVYYDVNQLQKALEFLQQALPVEREIGDRPGEARTLNNIGMVYSYKGQPRQALSSFQKALPLEREIGDRPGEAVTLSNIGFFYDNTGQPEKALRFYRKAIPLHEDLFQQITDSKQIGAFQQQNIVSLHARYAVAFWKCNRPQEALAMLERGRSTGLARLAALNRLPLQVLLGKDAPGWQQANLHLLGLETQISEMAARYRNTRNAEVKQTYASSLDTLRQKQQQAELDRSHLKQRLLVAHPDFARVFSQKPLIYSQLKKALLTPENADTLYLEYAVVYNKTILLFALSRSAGLHVFPLDAKMLKQRSLSERVNQWRESFDGAISVPEKLASINDLSRLLLGPLFKSGLLTQHRYSHLVVVADGPLLDVPFAALMTPQGKRLVQHYALSAPFSLTMLTWPAPYRATSTSLLAVANPPTDQIDLPQAEKQARALLPFFPSSIPLCGADATKANVLARMGQCQILHFGLHGEANNLNGLASCLLLAAPTGQDGRLTAAEITEHPLRAQLAVLSACKTLQGAKQGGEGLLGLTWAFRASGCPAVVASQWEVEEGATALLMQQFYAGLLPGKTRKRGLSKDEALRQAMLAVMRRPEYASPRSWAAFQVMGTTAPLRLISPVPAKRKMAVATGYRAE